MSLETALEQTATDAPETAPNVDLVGLFKAELDAESSGADKPKIEPEAPQEAAPDIESAEPEAEATQDEQPEASEQETPTAAIDAPRGMSEAEKAIYAQLPPEAKAWLAKREKDTQSDYTRKTQEVAEHRRTVEAQQQQVLAKLQQYDQILSQFTDRPLTPPDPALRLTDPLAYDEQLATYVHSKHLQESAAAEQARVRDEQQHHIRAQQQKYWAEESKQLAELAPELAKPESAPLRRAVYDYALKEGFTQQQLNNASARDLVTLWKAQRYDAAMSKKPAAPAPTAAPKVMQPGPARAAGRSNGFASAVQTLSQNPSRAALAAAYRAELAQEK